MDSNGERAEKRSLISLIASLPTLVIDLVKSELDQLKQEMLRKLKHAGIGVGFFAAAAVFAFFLVGVLTAAAILGLAVVFPGWLAALIVAAVLMIFMAVFVLVGINQMQKGNPEPTETLSSVRRDVRVIKGTTKQGDV